MKQVICLLQGLSDQPLSDLEGDSPAEKAHMPYLDDFIQKSSVFSAEPKSCQVEEVLFELLGEGYLPLSKAAMQVLGLGFTLAPNQVALSLRFVCSVKKKIVEVSNEILSNQEGKAFCKELNRRLGNKGFHFLSVGGPEAVMIAPKDAIPTPPGVVNPIARVGTNWIDGFDGANFFTKKIFEEIGVQLEKHPVNLLKEELEDYPVNAFIFSHGGVIPDRKKDAEKGILYTNSLALKGVAKLIGLSVWNLPHEHRRFSHIPILLSELPFIVSTNRLTVLDIPHIWMSTYKGDLLEKIKTLEWLDKNFLAPLFQMAEKEEWELSVMPLTQVDITEGCEKKGAVPIISFDPDREVLSNKTIQKYSENLTLDAEESISFSQISCCGGLLV